MRAKPVTRAARPVRSCKLPPKSPTQATTSALPSAMTSLNDEKKTEEGDLSPGNAGADISVLRSSIDTSVTTLAQLAKLYENGTPELCNLLTNECSIIYECKVCRNLFRSLANFVSHKRSYCPGKYADEMEQVMLNRKGATIDNRTTTRQDIISLLDGIIEKSQPLFNQLLEAHREARLANHTVVLREMNKTPAGVINSNENYTEEFVTLGPDGRILDGGDASDDSGGGDRSGESVDDDHTVADHDGDAGSSSPVTCPVCHKRFATQRSLAEHSQAAHSNYCECYVCPCCKKYFTNTWCIYRHLYKDHRKSKEQVRKLRTQIKRKQVTPDELSRSRNPPTKSLDEKPYDQDKAWIEELEGNLELQCCIGCGKRFDRRVALISHSQTCQKGNITSSGVGHQRLGSKRLKQQQGGGGGGRAPSPQQQTNRIPSADGCPEPRSGRIQVRMYYDKSHQGGDQQQQRVMSPSPSPQQPMTPPQLESHHPVAQCVKPDSDVTDVVSRYRRDVDVHDKYRRLEAKLLQLHRVAVEEVEGHLTGPVPQTELSVQEVIGATDAQENQAHVPPLVAPLVSTTSEFEDKEQNIDQDMRVALSKDAGGSSITSCSGQDIIIIDEDRDEGGEYIVTEADVSTYLNRNITDETDVTSTITIPGNSPDENDDYRSRIENKINSCIDWLTKKCLICSRHLDHSTNIRHHLSYHLKITNYECTYGECNYKSYLRVDMARHLAELHKGFANEGGRTFRKRFSVDEMAVEAAQETIIKNSKGSPDEKEDDSKLICAPPALIRLMEVNENEDTSLHSMDSTNEEVVNNRPSLGGCEDKSTDETNVEDFMIDHLKKYGHSSDGIEYDILNNPTPSNNDKLRAAIMEVILGSAVSPNSGSSSPLQDKDFSLPLINFDELTKSHNSEDSDD